jgi:hypothetical protein
MLLKPGDRSGKPTLIQMGGGIYDSRNFELCSKNNSTTLTKKFKINVFLKKRLRSISYEVLLSKITAFLVILESITA